MPASTAGKLVGQGDDNWEAGEGRMVNSDDRGVGGTGQSVVGVQKLMSTIHEKRADRRIGFCQWAPLPAAQRGDQSTELGPTDSTTPDLPLLILPFILFFLL